MLARTGLYHPGVVDNRRIESCLLRCFLLTLNRRIQVIPFVSLHLGGDINGSIEDKIIYDAEAPLEDVTA